MTMFNTILQDIRVRYPNRLDEFENRGPKFQLLNKAVQNTASPRGIISQDVVNAAAASWGRGVEIPVISPTTDAVGTGITCSPAGIELVTDLVGIAWTTVSYAFKMQPAKNDQNDIKYPQEFSNKYINGIRAIGKTIEDLIDTTLTSNITPAAQYASSYVGTGNRYPFTANVMGVALANHDDFFNDAPDILEADDLEGPYDVIGSTNMRSLLTKIRAQGSSNSENKEYQFEGDTNFNFITSNRVTLTPTTAQASMYIMPEGSFGIVNRVRPDCEAMRMAGVKQFGVVRNEPTLGLDLGTISWTDCQALNGVTNNAQDTVGVEEYHQMEVMIGLLVPYSNFANSGVSSVIRKADFLKV